MRPVKMLIGIAVVALALVSCQKSDPVPASKTVSPKVERKVDYWTCSMHPQIRADKPGDCPICGMTLVPVYAADAPKAGGGGAITLSEEGIRQAGVAVEKAGKRKLTKELLIFGTLGYDLNLHRDVVPLVSGRVQRQFINFNTTEVKKGDPLLSLYSPEALTLQEEYLKALRERWLSTFYERDLVGERIAQGVAERDDVRRHAVVVEQVARRERGVLRGRSR
ncbi:MAG: efflux RND transporter periplasmic adaptor subunit, partial [Verrucomicrobiales bacterium]|nr:efflux RND transporter periplasmic adaptor subunit [Verrucomicrobiales bacterium]